jgi:NAD/NADP transhydrogenase beta subunit
MQFGSFILFSKSLILFYMDKTMMVFGDAKKVIEDMVKAVE